MVSKVVEVVEVVEVGEVVDRRMEVGEWRSWNLNCLGSVQRVAPATPSARPYSADSD